MTYAEFRRYGYVSRLSDVLVCKGPGQQINTGNNITGQQLGVASQAGQRSADDYYQFKTLMQPLIQRDTALASGNRQEALAAAMPVISKLSAGWNGAKQNIMNMMPAGAARDKAMADLTMQMFSQIGGANAGMVQQAPSELAGLGGQFGNMALQNTGAQLSALQGGSTTNFNTGQMEAQKQKALLDFFGGLAGSAAGMFKIPIGGGSGTGGCWIAEAIYGVDDPRTLLVRWWLNGPFRLTARGKWVMRGYHAIGRQIAWGVRRSVSLRCVLKPLFDRALYKALGLPA